MNRGGSSSRAARRILWNTASREDARRAAYAGASQSRRRGSAFSTDDSMVRWISGPRPPDHMSAGSSEIRPRPLLEGPSAPLSIPTDSTAALTIEAGFFERSISYMSLACRIGLSISRSLVLGCRGGSSGPRGPWRASRRDAAPCAAMFLNTVAAAPGSSSRRPRRQCSVPARARAFPPSESSSYQAALPGADIPAVIATITPHVAGRVLSLETIRRASRTISAWCPRRFEMDLM